jgi:hypothetical protein
MAREDTRRTEESNPEEITDNEEILESRVGRSGQWGDPTDEPVVEVSFEEIMELQDELEGDDTLGDIIDTAHGDGSTDNVQVAMDQGLVYDPPTDPPVVPSDDLQGAEIAAGFASSIEDDPEVENLPESVDDNDEDIEQDIRRELRYNSETTHLDDVRIYVRNGVAYLRGTVLDDADISIVEEFVRDLDLVDEIENELEVAD